MRIKAQEEETPEIGLIALIDCIFFLLMFFMMATSFKKDEEQPKPEPVLPLTLPKAQASFERAQAGAAPLTIGVDKNGELYLAGKAMTTQGLHDALKKEAAANPSRPVRIDGDEATSYQHIVHVLELCQFEGFTRISMHARK